MLRGILVSLWGKAFFGSSPITRLERTRTPTIIVEGRKKTPDKKCQNWHPVLICKGIVAKLETVEKVNKTTMLCGEGEGLLKPTWIRERKVSITQSFYKKSPRSMVKSRRGRLLRTTQRLP